MRDTGTVVQMERVFLGLADRTRLRLLNLMGDQEVCVCYFVEILQLPQPTISRHLAYLRRTGLVSARRQGKWMHYRIAVPKDQNARKLLMGVLNWFAADRQMQRERSRLGAVSCVPGKLIRIQGAPTPVPVGDLQGRY